MFQNKGGAIRVLGWRLALVPLCRRRLVAACLFLRVIADALRRFCFLFVALVPFATVLRLRLGAAINKIFFHAQNGREENGGKVCSRQRLGKE